MTHQMFAQIDFPNWLSYELVQGNAVWRFIVVLLVMLVAMASGRIGQFFLNRFTKTLQKKDGFTALGLFLSAMRKPIYVFAFAVGIYLAKSFLVFSNPEATPAIEGIAASLGTGWDKINQVMFAISVAYALFHLVDVMEYYLNIATRKTDTTLDDMLVPVIRKAIRVTISIIAILFVAESIFDAKEVKTFLLSAGIGGVAIALAAKDTIANFFGSVMIFADRPFHINELVKIDGYTGSIEEVGFRSTRMRTLEGHMVTIPNSNVANASIENVGARKLIRRTSNITITYDAGAKKAKRAVEIITGILEAVPEINTSKDHPPRVYFDDFNDWSLNIYMTYWVSPSDYWVYKDVAQRVNLEMMKQFEAEEIEFAFPSQTLYLKNDDNA